MLPLSSMAILPLGCANVPFIISIMLAEDCKYPSSSEFQLELSENWLGSPLLLGHPQAISQLSLEYTVSQISIERELEDQVPSMTDSLPFCSLRDKESAYATVSTRHTLASAVKATFPSLPIRTLSTRKRPSLEKISATLTVCPIEFEPRLPPLLPSRQTTPSSEKFRLRKSISAHARKSSARVSEVGKGEGFGMGGSEWAERGGGLVVRALKAKRISLQQNEARGKIYMKKVIQTRASVLHLSDTSELLCSTRRVSFRM